MISVESIMTPDPVSLRPDDTLETANNIMNDRHIHHIPIIDDQGQLVGLISHRDVLAANSSILSKHPTDNSQTKLGDLMTSPVVSIPPQTGTLKAAQYIHSSRHGCLPIIDDGNLIGIITEYDFVEVAMSLLEQKEVKPFEDQNTDNDIDQFADTPEDLGIDVSTARDWD